MNHNEPSPDDIMSAPPAGNEIIGQSPRMLTVRKPLLSQEDENAVGQNSPTSPTNSDWLSTGSGANHSRTTYILKYLAVLFIANAALFGSFSWWYYQRTKAEFMVLAGQIKPDSEKPPEATSRVIDPVLSARIDGLEKQLAEIGKKIQSSNEQAAQNSIRLTELTAQMADFSKPAPIPELSTISTTPATDLPPAQSELVLLKERNRLSAYADEAIATGARGPYERLWDSLDDPRLASLTHAARSEILRVQNCYLSGQRVKYYGIQQYQIQVAEFFPDSAALAPAQLSDDQLIQILQNQAHDWQARVKAAWHLGQRRTTKSAEALVKAIKVDPVLDVVAEATFSFEQVTGYHAKLFEVQPLLAWWSSYNKAPQKAGAASDKNKNAGDRPAN